MSSTEAGRSWWGSIVVGVDDSEASVRALVWAIREGERSGLAVEVLTVWPDQDTVLVHEVPGHYSDARGRAGSAQRRTVKRAERQVGELSGLTRRLVNGRPVEALLAASRTSTMLVLGSRHVRHDLRSAGATSLLGRCYEESSCSVSIVEPSGAVRRREPRVDRA